MKEKTIQAVFNAIDEVNKQLPKDQQVEKSLETVLKGDAAQLDSLGLVNFIVAVEEQVQSDFEVELTLVDEPEIWDNQTASYTVGMFCDQLARLLEASASVA